MLRLLASSVVRGVRQDESHGGLFIVNCDTGEVSQVVDWNTPDIDFSGRGGDRGLRGIAVHGRWIFAASNNAIHEFSHDFSLIRSIRSPCFRHLHELAVVDDRLFVASTGIDGVVGVNLETGLADIGFVIASDEVGPVVRRFDPASDRPPASARFHINMVAPHPGGGLTIAGAKLSVLLRIRDDDVRILAKLPVGTHNAHVDGAGAVVFNDTRSDRIVRIDPQTGRLECPVPSVERSTLIHADCDDGVVARVGFARGYCRSTDGRAVFGTSPSRVTVFDWSAPQHRRTIILSNDVRNAVHGLAEMPDGLD